MRRRPETRQRALAAENASARRRPLVAARRAPDQPRPVLKGRNYVLTAKAERLAPVVANATRALAEVFEEQPSFDAATSTATIWVNNCQKLVLRNSRPGNRDFYFKNGVYTCTSSICRDHY